MILRSFSRIFSLSSQNCLFFSQSTPIFKDTIFALSTGSNKAGISIIRVSGENSLKSLLLLEKHDYPYKEKIINNDNLDRNEVLQRFRIKERYAHFRKFYEIFRKGEQITKINIIDQGLIFYFPEGKSFTGEDIVEFHFHGSKAVQTKFIMELSKIKEFRMAEPGEFSKRAFLNGKMDLMQVEGLSDLINSETEEQRIQSLQQHLGESSILLEKWRIELIRCLAHVEAFIDFESDQEDVQKDVFLKTNSKIREISGEIEHHLNDNHRGEIIRDGYKVSLIGPPNSGKSTLLNLLSKRDVAIVSEVPGTTRDIVSVSLNLAGYQINLFDTAGLRETNDAIEKEGMRRSIKSSENSNVNLFVIDIEDINVDFEKKLVNFKPGLINNEILKSVKNSKTVCVINKIDKINEKKFPEEVCEMKCSFENFKWFIFISCKEQKNINSLIFCLQKQLDNDIEMNIDGLKIITKLRHRLELQDCHLHLKKFLNSNLSIDVCGEELRSALNALGRIVGRIDVEDVLDVLFQDFCIGK